MPGARRVGRPAADRAAAAVAAAVSSGATGLEAAVWWAARPTTRSGRGARVVGRRDGHRHRPVGRCASSSSVSGLRLLYRKPNTGKSTLTNALVGAKVAITSNRPQTTRHTIRGIVHRENFQISWSTPRSARPRTLLGQRLTTW